MATVLEENLMPDEWQAPPSPSGCCRINEGHWALIQIPEGSLSVPTDMEAGADQEKKVEETRKPENENGVSEEELKRASMDSTKTTADEDEALNLYKDLVEKSAGNAGSKDAFHMDGDYLILIEARKRRKKENVEPTLWNILEGGENYVPVRSNVANKSREELQSAIDGATAEQNRARAYELVEKRDVEGLQEFFTDRKTMLKNLTMTCYREPNSAKTFLHQAIDLEAWDVATYLMQNGGLHLIRETFSLKIDGSLTTKTALHQLSENGNTSIVKKLLKHIKDKSVLNNYLHKTTLIKATGQRPREMMCMHIAALHGHNELVKLFLGMGVQADVVNKKNDTPLLWAVRGGHLDVVNTLLDHQCDVNHENDKGSTPLYWSVRYGHKHILLTLIKQGQADVNKKRKMGFVTPIILGSAMGYSEIVNILADNGADVNITIRHGETALQHAASEGNQSVVKVLIVHGADVNAQDEAGNTPLTLAAKNQHAAVTYLLASAGANLDHVTHEGKSVWHYAIENSTNDVLVGLVEYMRRSSDFFIHGLENIVQFPVGKTPLHIAAQKGDFTKVKCLLDLGVDRDSQDERGNNFLHIAAKHNNKIIIKTYGDKENVNKKNSDGDTVLLIACKNGNFDAALAALKHAKADDVNIRNETALHLVAKNSESEPAFVEKLVDVMIKKHSWTVLDSADEKGNTALHVAAKIGSPAIISSFRYLDIKATNQEGNNPLHIATKRGDWDVFDALLETFGGRGKELDYDQQNKNGESLLHIAAEKLNIPRVKQLIRSGTDVDIQDADGNTVLHKITAEVPGSGVQTDELLSVFMAIVDESVWWWCVKYHLPYPEDDTDKYNSLKRDAVMFLLTALPNKDDLSVLQLAASIGAKEVVECILNIREVFRFHEKPGFVKYDVTHLTPDTLVIDGAPKYTVRRRRKDQIAPAQSFKPDMENPEHVKDQSEPSESLVETIVRQSNVDSFAQSADDITRTVRMFDITPLNKMVGNYWSKYQWAYGLLMMIHILYMSLFSAFISEWLPKSTANTIIDANNNTVIQLAAVTPRVWPTVLTLTWPTVILIFGVYSIVVGVVHCSKEKRRNRGKESTTTVNALQYHILVYLNEMFSITFALCVIVWFILYCIQDTTYQDFIVAISLILGWLYTIQFTKGFRNIHHLSLMLKNMIVRDMVKFIFLYFFVLLAFSMAFHVLFQASAPRSTEFPSVFDSMYFVYNIMIGMADFTENVPDQDFESIGKTTGFIKIIYIVYTILSNVVLLNLLIALMNDSYSTISAEQTNNWRVNSVLLALDIEKELPILPKIFYAITRQNNLFFDEKCRRWFITLSVNSSSYEGMTPIINEVAEQMRVIENRLDNMESKFDISLQTILKRIDEMKPDAK